MSQYRDPFIGGGGGNGGGRSRNENAEYMYRRREEDDGFQYSPAGGDTRYGYGTDMDSRSTSRPIQQPRRPQQPMSSRQGGNVGQSFPIPPVPRAPSNSSGNRGLPPQRPRQNNAPSSLDSSEVQEVQQNPNFSYRLNQRPVRSQPRYSQQSEDDRELVSPTNRPSVSSSRSIFIGFDPSNSPDPTTSSLGVIPNFPSVPPIPSGSNRKSSGAGPPPSARRGTSSSYYSQQALMVSPIPEESLGSSDRHGSYASSTAIPTSWGNGPIEFFGRDDHMNDSDEYESRVAIEDDIEEERGLVRQASLGRKSRPVITEIRSKSVDQGGSKSTSSNESLQTYRSARATSRSPAAKSSPTLNPVAGGSASSLPSIPSMPHPQSPASSTSDNSPIIQPPVAFTTDIDYMDEKFTFPMKLSQPGSKAFDGSSGSPWEAQTSLKAPAPAGGLAGRRIPPRLNLDAVREAEARGSLTSLPDLIRRATKLAAVLETGRPDSRWGMRGSFMGNSSSRSGGRDTDSISDILASFPPPVLAQGKNRGTRTLSQWPLPGDFTHENDSSIRPSRKQGRRICGLPLWAFILLVILALLVISAAVIVPLQLVNLSKGDNDDDNNSPNSLVADCKERNPCQNGGENIATKDFCGCVCTNGFTGSDCSQKDDLSCTTVDLKDRGGGRIKGIQNVTMGNALPRLFNLADPFYNIELDMAVVLAVFSNESISCTAQNALVTFNGESIPSTASAAKRALADAIDALEKRQTLTVDTSATPTATATTSSSDTRVPELDPDAIDFARVVVLYLTNFQSLKTAGEAQKALQSGFTAGRDFGDLSVGNNITVDFDSRSIQLSDGDVVGSVTANATTNSTTTSGTRKRSILETYLGDLLS